ncbi:hypothetical protein HanPI659440_Chr16g0649691 [Helianthus annuus]|nr:hypothetical protein HanPI659440_Chr16g0649691 [Helianthus annuus]
MNAFDAELFDHCFRNLLSSAISSSSSRRYKGDKKPEVGSFEEERNVLKKSQLCKLGNTLDSSVMETSESVIQSEKDPRISYTRDFHLSLSELEICKSLPSGFDQSKSILRKPRISYTRDFLLSLSELEICKSLPSGFGQSNSCLRKPRISYTRDFLLSLSELEICKSLPSGFDQSKSILR